MQMKTGDTYCDIRLDHGEAEELAEFLEQFADGSQHMMDQLYEALSAWLSPEGNPERRQGQREERDDGLT